MTLGDLLAPERVLIPLEGAPRLEDALERLVPALASREGGPLDVGTLRALVESGAAELVHPHEDVLLLLVARPEAPGLAAALGVSPQPVSVDWEDGADGAKARAILLAATPGRLSALRAQLLPPLARILSRSATLTALLEARSADDVRELEELMEVRVRERLLVEDAFSPLTFRVYPDTPVGEVIDLVARKGLRAVPVVGQKYEVLGIITSGEALRHFLMARTGRDGEGRGGAVGPGRTLTARDLMSRSVMCVAEDEDLFDAANLLVNKDVAQLPVVREGEIIGFLNRDDVLRTLVGA